MFDYALKNTLEKYYVDVEEFDEQLEALKESIDEKAEEIIENYEAALEERNSADELDYFTDKIIVVFEPEVEEKHIEQIAEEQFGELDSTNIIEDIDLTGLSKEKKEQIQNVSEIEEDTVAIVDISLGQTIEQAIDEYSQYKNVKYAEPDYELMPTGLTYDSYSDDQWYLNHINIKPGWYALETSGMIETWIAVIDSGIQVTHPDLKNVYIKSRSVDVTKSGYPRLNDLSQPYIGTHGTRVSGVVAAEANNGKGIAGVATGGDISAFRLMAIKAVPNDTKDYKMSISNMVKAMYYAVDNGADVINISYSGSNFTRTLEDAIFYAYQADVLVVASAGNDNSNVKNYPAAYDYANVISVAAINQNNKRVVASTWGSNYGSTVDISAPGINIKTTDIDSKYIASEGTSYAAPIVTGVVAVMNAITFGELSADVIREILIDSAKDIGVSNMGAGVINGGLAIQMAKNTQFKSEKEVLKSVAATTTKGNLKIKWDDGATYAYQSW